MTPNVRHARDIPDAIFLEAVRAVTPPWSTHAMIWDLCAELERQGFDAGPMYSGHPQRAVPEKIVRAKVLRLMRRELMDGCACGCRDDFEVTAAGQRYLEGSAA